MEEKVMPQVQGWPKRTLIAVSLALVLIVSLTSGAVGFRLKGLLGGSNSSSTPSPSPGELKRELVLEESTVIRAVKKVSPSVVSIAVSRRMIDGRERGIGTGFIIDKGGLIVTNRHVVSESNLQYVVITKDDKKYQVQRVFRDPSLDIAIVKIDANGLTPLELGDSSTLEVGQLVIAVGNALGRFKNTVTTGVVSGIRSEGVEAGDPFSGITEQLGEVIQTDAAINLGNSGGPLLDSSGRVIGVNVAVTQGAQNIGFAIPITAVKPIIDEFLRTGKITRPYLGVRYEIISKTRALAFEVPEGAYIREVVAGSPAEKAGIKEEDILISIDNQPINESNSLATIIQKKKIGDTVSVVLNRDDREVNITATLAEAPSEL